MAAHRETVVGLDAQLQVQVAGLAAVAARLALAGQTNLLAVLDPGGDVRLELLTVHAQGHRGALDRLTERQRDLRVAVLAVLGTGRLLIPAVRRPAIGAAGRSGTAAEHREDVVDVRRSAAVGLEADVRAVAAAEHRPEDVGEAASVEPAAPGTAGEARPAHAELADGVILLAAVLVAQHVIGFGDVLELLLGLLGFVQIRMVLASELTVGLGDLLVAGVLGDTEDLVEILGEPFILSHSRCLLSLRKSWVCTDAGCPANGRGARLHVA